MISHSNQNILKALYAGCASVLLILAIVGYSIIDKNKHIDRPKHIENPFFSDMTYMDLPRVNVALGKGIDTTHVRVNIALEVTKKDLPIIEGYQPRIMDKLSLYLGSLTPEQLRMAGTSSIMRQSLLQKANAAGAPVPIHDLFFEQIVIM